MSLASFFECLPSEIFELITDKLTYYQCHSLGLCSVTLLNLTFNDELFWRHRLIKEFDRNPATPNSTTISYKKKYKLKLTFLRSKRNFLKDMCDKATAKTQQLITYTPKSLKMFSKHCNQLITFAIPQGDIFITQFIKYVICGTIGINVNMKEFIDAILRIDFIWDIKNEGCIKLNREVNSILVDHGVEFGNDNDFRLIDKLEIVENDTEKYILGRMLLGGILSSNFAQVSETLVDRALKLVKSPIKQNIFYNRRETINLARTMDLLFSVFRTDNSNPLHVKILNTLLEILNKLDKVIIRAICRRLLIRCSSYVRRLEILLNHPGFPQFDLDDMAFQLGIHSRLNNRYKACINDYVARFPNCVSQKGYDKLMAC